VCRNMGEVVLSLPFILDPGVGLFNDLMLVEYHWKFFGIISQLPSVAWHITALRISSHYTSTGYEHYAALKGKSEVSWLKVISGTCCFPSSFLLINSIST
jgi:hypothetical protein